MSQFPPNRASGENLSSRPEILPPEEEIASADSSQVVSDVDREGALALRSISAEDPLYGAAQSTAKYIQASKAKATRRAYASDWKDFVAWCEENRRDSLPAQPGTVALYLSSLADTRKPATITRRLTSITTAHKMRGFDSPAVMRHQIVSDTLHGIRRTHGTAQTMKKPLTRERIVTVIGTLEGPIAAARDKALLLLGFAGSLRREELAAMRVEHIKRHRKGITINLPKSKNDQEGKGRQIDILYGVHDLTCPILALDNWLKIAGIEDGFVLRRVWLHGEKIGESLSKDSIGRIVKRMVRRAKLDDPKEYGGHSLRAGFVTEASANGATDRQIMKQTGHKSVAMVHRYSREDQSDRQIAYSKLGL